MKKIITYLKNLRLRSFLTVLLAGVILCVSTACNSGDTRGARTEVPPVQMGGQNNPHKAGGDNLNKYKQSPKPNTRGQAALPTQQLLAATPKIDQQNPGLQYKGDTEVKEQSLPIISEDRNRQLAPEERQPVVERTNPNERILEKTGKAFKESSEFIKGSAEKVSPESR